MAVSSVASTTTSTTVANVNVSRRRLVFKNTDANECYILLDSGTASASLHSFSLAEGEDADITDYDGEVNAVWATDGAGALMVTEY